MKVLITSIPGHGHICPLLPLANALSQSGHSVAFATSSGFRAELNAAGVELLASGPGWHESEFSGDAPHAPRIEGFRTNLLSFLESTVVPQMLADVTAHVECWKPDIILSNDYESCGRAIAEIKGIPFVLASSGPRLPRVFRDQMQGPLHRKARALSGLDQAAALEYSFKWLHLCFSPPSYHFVSGVVNKYEASPVEYGIRPAIGDSWHACESISFARRSYDRPVVLCTFGTVFNKNPAVLEAVIAGLSDKVGRLIVLLGPGAVRPAVSCEAGVVEFVSGTPLSLLLPHVDYCVTHGGTSTLMATLLHGKPSILLPQGADQLINAVVCDQKKLAVMKLNTTTDVASVSFGKLALTRELVGRCFDELLSNPIYRHNLQLFGQELQRLPGLEFAVCLLEQLARTGSPVISFAQPESASRASFVPSIN